MLITVDVTTPPEAVATCTNCEACCCRLEVLLITDTGVPERFAATDRWGGKTMARLDDGYCAALDQYTMMCKIYDNRPLICREFVMGGRDCLAERAANHPTKGNGSKYDGAAPI